MQTIILPVQCDRGAVATLLPEIAQAVGAGDVTIDGSAVTRAGQVLLQLLLSAQATARACGTTLVITSSDGLRDTARNAGLAGLFGAEATA